MSARELAECGAERQPVEACKHERLGHAPGIGPYCLDCDAADGLSGVKNYRRVVKPADPVNHPSHYTSHPSGIECIDVVEHMGFSIGNAIKYLWRAGLKGALVEDLKKARWYIDREIQRLEPMASEDAERGPIFSQRLELANVVRWLSSERFANEPVAKEIANLIGDGTYVRERKETP
jgi:hypothetical protein